MNPESTTIFAALMIIHRCCQHRSALLFAPAGQIQLNEAGAGLYLPMPLGQKPRRALSPFERVGNLEKCRLDHARLKKRDPYGQLKTNPAGTVMLGYPATAAAVVLEASTRSPSIRSVTRLA